MRQNNKRPAEDELQPSRTRKRQAAAPSTRITRSMRKTQEDSANPVRLHSGLPTASRQRKKPTPSALTQRECTLIQAPEQAATHVEPVAQPAAICSSAPGEPGKHATEAANPGGPAPIADMGSSIPMIITSCHTNIPDQKPGIWGISIKRRLRAHSNSSQISPLSGPARDCSVDTPSHVQTAYPELDTGLHGIDGTQEGPTDIMPADVIATGTYKSIKEVGSDVCKATQTKSKPAQEDPKDVMLAWSTLFPAWVEVPRAVLKPAVLNATYLVNSIKEAGELLINEIDAQKVDENQELPVVEVFLDNIVSQDSEHPSPMDMDPGPVIVECVANGSSPDNLECTMSVESSEVRDLQCNAAVAEEAAPTENIKACCPPTPVEVFCRSNAPSPSTTSGSLSAGAIEQSLPHAKPLSEPSKTTSASSTTAAEMPRLPPFPQKTRQQTTNLKREKELRARLIEMRKVKRMARQPCVQNVLVRTSDGSMSIITAKAAHVTNWDLEDDQYSVEEYEEDTVSY